MRLLTFLFLILLIGCKTPEPIVVHDVRTEYIVRTDTLHTHDSIITNSTTIVREVDSAAMAQYGVRLDGMQKAWLVLTDNIRNNTHDVRQSRTDTVIVRDSIPTPYPVIKEVEKKLSLPQKALMTLGGGLLAMIFLGLVYLVIKKRFP